ncbi:hypothetical protein Fot_37965 [Forsythia ovata]|uniref:Transposase n=1 Tax=Forsythia ovata TaxID=205694 RepID=A0ABD1S0G2_9LAMI
MAFWRNKNATQKVHPIAVSLSDNYQNFRGQAREYLQARRLFLNSYQLSEGNRLKEKMKRFWKRLGRQPWQKLAEIVDRRGNSTTIDVELLDNHCCRATSTTMAVELLDNHCCRVVEMVVEQPQQQWLSSCSTIIVVELSSNSTTMAVE